MKHFFASLFFALFFVNAYSQDVMLDINGNEKKIKFLQIIEDTIFFRHPPGDTTTRKIHESEVFMLKLENGVKIVIESKKPENRIVPETKNEESFFTEKKDLNPDTVTHIGGTYFRYQDKKYSIRRITPILKQLNDPEVNSNLRQARVVHNLGTISSFASLPLGLIATVNLLNYSYYSDPNSIDYDPNKADQHFSNLLASTMGVLVLNAGNIIFKKVIRPKFYKKAVYRYNQKIQE
ncbi:MAG: hypothetical protein ACK40G_11885 [Cytophagaceae bacterium]